MRSKKSPTASRGLAVLGVGIALIAWLTLGVASAASASTATIGGITYTVDDAHPELGATVSGYVSGTTIVIPDSVSISATNYPVTAIGDSVFQNTAITAVTIPDSVTTIGQYAFNSDHQLASLDLGTGVTTIGQYAFTNDNDLQTLVLPNSVTSVGQWAFDSEDLTSLTLSSGLTEIDTQAFSNENNLESVTIPPSVTTIDYAAFAADDIRNLVIGSGVTTIGQYAFAYNNNLSTVLIPPSVTSFGAQVFQNNSTGSLTATFQGAAPTTFGSNVFHVSNPLIVYDVAFGDPPVAGGFTSPTWMGYNTSSVAVIDFDANGHGTAPAPISAPVGHVVPTGLVPADPTASGYTFEGWFTSASGGTQWNFGTSVVTDDVTLFAHWDPASLAVISFNANGHGTAPAPISAPIGHVIPTGLVPADPTATGYTFEGWFTSASGGTQWNFGTSVVTDDVTLFAHWDPASLPVTGSDPTSGWIAGAIVLLLGALMLAWSRRQRAT